MKIGVAERQLRQIAGLAGFVAPRARARDADHSPVRAPIHEVVVTSH